MISMIVELPTESILLRENSQRKEYNNIEALANSIQRIGLLHPIVVDEENRLVAGGRRLAAFKLLGRETIPAVTREHLDAGDRRVVELEENIKRADLKWQEEAEAVVEIESILLRDNPEWLKETRAEYVGYSERYYSKMLMLGRAIQAGNERVINAPNATAAINILERESERAKDNDMNMLTEIILGNREEQEAELEIANESEAAVFADGETKDGKKFSKAAVYTPVEVITQGDMFEWMPNYSGPRFNLIHCDFPYGLDHGKSDQGGAKDRWKAYEDGPDLYWKLIRTLCECRNQIMLPKSHMIFWFSMKYYSETIAMFNALAPDLNIDYQPLVWHKTDNKGIIRDVEHTPRNVTETALFITRGDRQIIKAVGNCYGAPTGKADAIHISEKPVPVLKHFMQLCVDGHSEVLDPTCGGGSALRAAHSMGAKRVVGREVDEAMAIAAQREFVQMVAIESLRKKEE